MGKEFLKPQDIVCAAKMLVNGFGSYNYAELAVSLSMSPSEVHAAVRRLRGVDLLYAPYRDTAGLKSLAVLSRNFLEFVVHGLKYAFPAFAGELTYGTPTAFGMQELFPQTDDIIPVWPGGENPVRGYRVDPLYRSVPKAVKKDAQLHLMLAIIDVYRLPGEQNLAKPRELFQLMCDHYEQTIAEAATQKRA